MTVRHMVLFRFRPEADAARRRAVLDRLAELPSHYPAMRRFGLGENASERDDTFSHVMTLEFGDAFMGGFMQPMLDPVAKDGRSPVFVDCGHYLPEDNPGELGDELLSVL